MSVLFGNFSQDRTSVSIACSQSLQVALTLAELLGQLSFKRAKLLDLLSNQIELRAHPVAHMGARFTIFPMKEQQFTNFRERKPQLLGTSDELYAPNVLGLEEPEATVSPARPFEKALLLIETNCVHAQAGPR